MVNRKTFRHWIEEKWLEHVDECRAWRVEPCVNTQEYFNKNKYFLKQKYKDEVINNG
jgi:hypothetical protein